MVSRLKNIHYNIPKNPNILLLCLIIAAWIHLFFFIGWEKSLGANLLEIPDAKDLEIPLELVLEIPSINETKDNIIDESTTENITQNTTDNPDFAENEIAENKTNSVDEDNLEGNTANDDNLDTNEEIISSTPSNSLNSSNVESPISIENEPPKFKSYFTMIRSAVGRKWKISPEEIKNVKDFKPGLFKAALTLSREGEIVRITILNSSGSPKLDHNCMLALKNAAPFEPFPENLSEFSQLDILMQFDHKINLISVGKR